MYRMKLIMLKINRKTRTIIEKKKITTIEERYSHHSFNDIRNSRCLRDFFQNIDSKINFSIKKYPAKKYFKNFLKKLDNFFQLLLKKVD